MDPMLTMQAIVHLIYGRMRQLTMADDTGHGRSDRGAVSLEQVLWFVAAGAAVAAIAAIIWSKVRSAANSVNTK